MCQKQNVKMIEGMTEETARRYLEHRKKIDRKLNQLISLGKAIACSTCSEIDINISYFEDLCELVYDLSIDVSEKMDEYNKVVLKLGEIDSPKEHEK